MDTKVKLTAPVDENDHLRGQYDTPVTVVEYADYECPHSGQLYHVLKQLLGDMPQTWQLIFRNFPLTQIRAHALPAALAAEAAALQGDFWDMHDILYEHQDSLEPEHLIVYAQVLGLDLEQFIIDMTSDQTAARVREDFISGIRSGVNGTPALYIQDVRYDGVLDYDSLRQAIEQAAPQRTRHDKVGTRPARRRHAGTRL